MNNTIFQILKLMNEIKSNAIITRCRMVIVDENETNEMMATLLNGLAICDKKKNNKTKHRK